MADEARSLKAYGELPENSEYSARAWLWPAAPHILLASFLCFIPLSTPVLVAVRVNETDTFADEDGANDEYFDFEDISGET